MPASPLRQFAIQAAAALLVLSLAWPYYGMRAANLPWPETALVIGGVAFLLSLLSRQPPWWSVMHAVFIPLAWLVGQLAIAPGWFLLAFVVLLLIYRGAITGQVPLYLTNAATAEALAQLLASRPQMRFADLGAGIGSTVAPLARRFPEGRFVGVENAPLTWAAGWLRSRSRSNVEWRWRDLWQTDLKDFDVVYAFLSPAPMAALWQKVRSEMKPGSLFVSNSFPVPEVAADRVIEVDCTPSRSLYCYQL
ncbi:MAG: hypothetical protein H6R10_953 [Rhodocyclaceae bacterium]|nr:hypothetical protein [Rhodocyclaceae bacterium]